MTDQPLHDQARDLERDLEWDSERDLATGGPRLPVLDLRQLGDPAQAERFTDELATATRDWGFFYLTGHGIPDALQHRLIEVSRQFFSLPDSSKQQIDKRYSPQFRGYSRVGEELTRGRRDWREQIDIGPERPVLTGAELPEWTVLQGPNQWPAQPAQFRAVIEQWQQHTERVARTLLASWLQALGQPPGALDSAFTEPDVLLKVVRYPGNPARPGRPAEHGAAADPANAADPASGAAEAVDRSQGVGAHKDSGWLTLLFVEPGKGGLQVRHGDAWVDAPPLPGSLIVNIGELLEWATAGYLRATVHRVVSEPGTGDRISVPYFFNPAYGAEIPQWQLPEPLAAQARGVEDDPDNRIYSNYGLNALKSRLRSHPEVTAKYHAALADRLSAGVS
ncbi:isopenicillin N synthase family dioxygenase [Nakamurella aerolata]|uniref:Isopenicillin N synthase family oxygenase n=1 Tax=Nakamurella aerolata TaxID=1656892 RepID=A0A849AB47_9ACTN|nr:isopenicillin N synthase family oxygenase [Nakamurella aerolata]NNG36883.1 isopenicillin N synthase family oxygenase [Nakamurella aerolata]